MAGSGSVTHDVTDQVVLITGGGSRIGRQVAADFAAAGARVAIAGRTASRPEATVELITGSVTARTADIGDAGQVRDLVRSVVDEHGRIDVVVSNAAGCVPGDITDVDHGDWEQMRSTTVDGLFHLAQAVLPHPAGSGGSFIATSSVSGLRGDWGSAVDNATKGAVSLFVQALALDRGGRGVRVGALAPSVTNTEPVAAVTGNPALRRRSEERIPLGRVAEVDDISPVVLFLASDAARCVNGVVLPVDGGTSASTGQGRPLLD